MTTKNTLTQQIQDKIKHDMIYGYRDDEGSKVYPKLKEAADWYEISYDSLKQKARKWKWRQKRKDYQAKVRRKVAEKKEEEKLSESEAEQIVVDDVKFNKTAVKLRRAADQEIQNILDGNVTQSVGYHLMNCGKALESAQKISKIAAGEPSDISRVEGETNISVSPEDDVKNLEDALDQEVEEKSVEDVIRGLDQDEGKLQ